MGDCGASLIADCYTGTRFLAPQAAIWQMGWVRVGLPLSSTKNPDLKSPGEQGSAVHLRGERAQGVRVGGLAGLHRASLGCAGHQIDALLERSRADRESAAFLGRIAIVGPSMRDVSARRVSPHAREVALYLFQPHLAQNVGRYAIVGEPRRARVAIRSQPRVPEQRVRGQ